MKVVVDRVRCTGTGICETRVPAVFEIDDDGALVILTTTVAPSDVDDVRAAVVACPTEALSIIDD